MGKGGGGGKRGREASHFVTLQIYRGGGLSCRTEEDNFALLYFKQIKGGGHGHILPCRNFPIW